MTHQIKDVRGELITISEFLGSCLRDDRYNRDDKTFMCIATPLIDEARSVLLEVKAQI